ncbi:DEAD/DEAH box helicase [Agathobaculum butyriciproducens]|uniref:DEAD/DEAH box helicase n=1 Tax=Agathobaculum butyriciproducens TaxID=1628085 RepID=UPI003AF1214E
MKFNELKLEKNILKALKEAGYSEPTPIQQQAIPPVLEGRDLMGCAQTGTGKTCAFAVPIIQRLAKSEGRKGTIRALILTPTRELALQIYENVCQYARYVPCSAAVIFGGVSQVPQVEAIERGVDILIATPGRLWDLMGQKIVKLDKAEFFVLDEADRMLDMGFFPDVKRIVKFLPKKRQTLLFSATIPAEIADLAEKMLHEPEHISVTPSAKPADKIEQQLYFVEKQEKRELLPDIIRQSNVHQVLVFTRTKHGADRVARDLNRAGIKTKSIHGDKSQNQRQRALADFKECKIAVLVATDIAARGIDINDLPLVINFDLPNIPETYVHRIGRTGRAGQEGTAISFCDRSERPYLKDIEKLIGKRIPVAGEIPHEEKEEEKRESGQRRTTNKRSRRKPVSENATAEEVAADVAREKEAKKKARQARANAKRPSRREKAAEQQTEQQAKAAAPRSHKGRNDRNDSRRRGRRSDPYARFEKNEPRVDAHTPSRAYALSDEAAARIRRKVEAALAARAAKADGKAAPQQEKKGRGHGSRSAHKPAPQQNKTAQSKTAQSKTTNHRGRSADGTRARNGYRRRTPNNNRKG